LFAASIALAQPTAAVNDVRTEGCARRQPAEYVAQSAELDAVARELARGRDLNEALDRVAYPAARSESLYLKGPTDDTAIREVIEDRFCSAVTDPSFTEVGSYREGSETWIVLATRSERPAVDDADVIAARVLELVNAARAASRRCGRSRHDAVPPLALSGTLNEAAARHAKDMAQHGSFDHRGSDGSRPADRVTQAGYRWRSTGENIAAGQSTADAVVAAWLDSPGHCTNIMGPQYTEMGVAFALAPGRNPGIYWTQVFAAPQ
jgi:uncharacterized protein YkwD